MFVPISVISVNKLLDHLSKGFVESFYEAIAAWSISSGSGLFYL